ncbi:MAG: glutamyl-tRNA reductase [Actinobacteria bacterium]|nr:glutamyl-tRNA reductase [Actinomycetota bacterium]
MALVLIGASHHNLSLAKLELLERDAGLIRNRLFKPSNIDHGINGGVLISTCNRFEVYFDTEKFHNAVDHVIEVIGEISGLKEVEIDQALQVSSGMAVVQHLFAVTAGLESMIIGEAEIAGQVRSSFKLAQREKSTTPHLEQLFQRALANSKVVTHSTGLGAAGRSIVDVGLTVVQERYGDVADKRTLVLGTGAYARVVVAALQRRNCLDISVYSSSGRARQFSQSHNTKEVLSDGLPKALANADLIIACSGNINPVIGVDLIKATREGKEILPVIDVALTSDLMPEVKDLAELDVIDLDVIRDNAPREHGDEIFKAHEIVQKAVFEFENEQSARSMDPAVAAMRSHVGIFIDLEVKRVRDKLGDDVATQVELSLQRVTNALLHSPSVRARNLIRSGDQNDYRQALQVLFGIDLETLKDV